MVKMLLMAVATAAAAMLAQPSQARLPDANPALWVVRDADTTVYLFGTFHTLDGRSEWFNDEVHAAFSASDELVLEALLPKLDHQASPTVPAPGHSVTPSASFVGATRMAVSAGRDRGLDVRKGADVVLRAAADTAGKPVQGLETVEFQLNMLARMVGPAPRAGQPVEMDQAARAMTAELMARMQASWNRGDQRIFVDLLDRMRETSPNNYRVMFPERNAHWANWIENRMEQPGTVFVAVGAGHFAGRDSVLAKLTSKGILPARCN